MTSLRRPTFAIGRRKSPSTPQLRGPTRFRSNTRSAVADQSRDGEQAQAAVEARKLYQELRANGWDETLRTQATGRFQKRSAGRSAIYRRCEGEKRHLREDPGRLRGGVAQDRRGHLRARRHGGQEITDSSRSLAREINAIKLRTLTREKIETWRVDFIRRKGIDPLSEKSARVSANTFIRRARSLFAETHFADPRHRRAPGTAAVRGLKVEKSESHATGPPSTLRPARECAQGTRQR